MTIPSFEEQSAWMRALRAHTATIEFVFNEGDAGHPLVDRLAHLVSTRTEGVSAGTGYARPRPRAVRRRFPYDRDIVHAIEEFGGLFTARGFSDLGDVDVVFRDEHDLVLGATVAHEGMLLPPTG